MIGGSARRVGVAALLFGCVPGCIPSNVVAPEQRMVVDDLSALAFEPAPGMQLDGLYTSVDIRGAAAASLRKVYYLFGADGTYTAAALTEAGGVFAFQTLDGTWRSAPEGLVLDDAEPVRLERADGHVRIATGDGALVLRHERSW